MHLGPSCYILESDKEGVFCISPIFIVMGLLHGMLWGNSSVTAEKAADTSDLILSSARRWHHQTCNFFFLSWSWARILQTTEPRMQLWSVNSICAPCVCGFAFGGGAPLVMRCKMAALCQEKVRQRLVTLGKIRQEKSKNVLSASAWLCLHTQQNSGFPHLLLSRIRYEDLLPITEFSANSVPLCPLCGPKHQHLILISEDSFCLGQIIHNFVYSVLTNTLYIYIFELVPQVTNRGLCRTINLQRLNVGKLGMFAEISK